MKEFETRPNQFELTGQPHTAYSKGMPEPRIAELPKSITHSLESPPPRPRVKKETSVSVEDPTQTARRAWETLYKLRGQKLEDLSSDERSTVEIAIKNGVLPDIMRGGQSIVSVDGLSDERIINKISLYERFLPYTENTREMASLLRDLARDVQSLSDVPPNEVTRALDNIERAIRDVNERQRQEASDGNGENGGEARPQEEAPVTAQDEAIEHRTAAELLRKFNEILSVQEVRNELQSTTPNFNKPELQALRSFFDEDLDPTTAGFHYFAELIARSSPTGEIRLGDNVVRVSNEATKVLFEWTTEKIIGIPDKGPEDAPYNIGQSLQLRNNEDAMRNLLFSYFSNDKEFISYIENLTTFRQMAHELRRNLSLGESYKKYVQEGLKTSGLDFLRNRINGVSEVIRLYEDISASRVAEKKEWFDNEDVLYIDRQVEEAIRLLYETGNLKDKKGRVLTDWERDRALRIGKTVFAGTQRFAIYSSIGNLPPAVADKIGSLPYEYIVRALVPFKVTAVRFFSSEGGSKALLKKIFEAQRKEDPSIKPLFGINEDVMASNIYGAVDAESHSWRSQLMFLGNIIFDENGRKTNLLDVVDGKIKQLVANMGGTIDERFGVVNLDEEGKKELKERLSTEVEEYVLGQTLYLSALARFGEFDSKLKEKIWQKIALLSPSTIASLAPEVIEEGEKPLWERLRHKAYIANVIRVREESEKYFDDEGKGRALTTEQIEQEASLFRLAKTNPEARYRFLRYFSEQNGNELDNQEEELLKKIIDKGFTEKAKVLASTRIPFAVAINDAPVVAWKKTGVGNAGLSDEDIYRILLSDQQHFSEGWNEINALIDSPTSGAIEHFAKAVEGIAGVTGKETAQKIVEPFIEAYVEFASTAGEDVWIPGKKTWDRFRRKPTSEIEKYFRSSFISMDEEERAVFLDALSQAKAISDDTTSLEEGLTQLDRLKKKTKSSRSWVMIATLRSMIMLVGPVFAYEFFKSLIR